MTGVGGDDSFDYSDKHLLSKIYYLPDCWIDAQIILFSFSLTIKLKYSDNQGKIKGVTKVE